MRSGTNSLSDPMLTKFCGTIWRHWATLRYASSVAYLLIAYFPPGISCPAPSKLLHPLLRTHGYQNSRWCYEWLQSSPSYLRVRQTWSWVPHYSATYRPVLCHFGRTVGPSHHWWCLSLTCPENKVFKSRESRLFAELFVQAHIKENIKVPCH